MEGSRILFHNSLIVVSSIQNKVWAVDMLFLSAILQAERQVRKAKKLVLTTPVLVLLCFSIVSALSVKVFGVEEILEVKINVNPPSAVVALGGSITFSYGGGIPSYFEYPLEYEWRLYAPGMGFILGWGPYASFSVPLDWPWLGEHYVNLIITDSKNRSVYGSAFFTVIAAAPVPEFNMNAMAMMSTLLCGLLMIRKMRYKAPKIPAVSN